MRTSRRVLLGGGALALLGTAVGVKRFSGPGASPGNGESRARRISADGTLPARADVVIAGGGNIGAASAYYLSKLGLSVVLCEKGAIGCEASGRSLGWVWGLGLPPEKIAIAVEAKRLWPGLNAELGIETGYRQNGLLMQVPEEARPFWEEWLNVHSSDAPSARMLESRDIARHVAATPTWVSAVFDPTDGCAEPTLVAAAFAEAARRNGASLLAPCAVRGFETSAGRLSSVVTERGEIATSTLIVAGGAWSSTLLNNSGLRLPSANLFSWCVNFNAANGPDGAGSFSNVAWRRQIDGGYTASIQIATAPLVPELVFSARSYLRSMRESQWEVRPRIGSYFFRELIAARRWQLDQISPFERRRILEPGPYPELIDEILEKMRLGISPFRRLRMNEAWGGALTSTPDDLPVLGPVAATPGLLLATGVSEGLSMAPAIGRNIAALVTGATPSFALDAFRFERFAA